jgi:hypothetical protein
MLCLCDERDIVKVRGGWEGREALALNFTWQAWSEDSEVTGSTLHSPHGVFCRNFADYVRVSSS